MISVIVPIYNVEPYLEEAIESLLCQTYTNLEIILVDDGSTDGSGKICDRYEKEDSRIKVIHQENKGLSAARNAGIDRCRGEMIAFLDPDDAFCRDMLFKMSEAIQKSGADMAECNFVTYKGIHPMDPQKVGKKRKCIAPGEELTGLYGKKNVLHMHLDGKIATNVWNKLYKRRMWDSLRFPEGQNYEDLDIILPLLGETECVCILDEPLIMHRKRPGSITATHTFKNVRDRELAYRHYTEYTVSHTPEYFEKKDLNTALARQYSSLLSQYHLCASSRMPERKKCLDYLSRQILDVKSRIDIKECSLKLRISSFLYSYAPGWVSGLIYRVYVLLRMCIMKLVFR